MRGKSQLRAKWPSSDNSDSDIVREETTMKPLSEPSAHWRGRKRVLSGRGDWMSGSYLTPSASATLSAQQVVAGSPPDLAKIIIHRLVGKAKREMVRRERDEAHE